MLRFREFKFLVFQIIIHFPIKEGNHYVQHLHPKGRLLCADSFSYMVRRPTFYDNVFSPLLNHIVVQFNCQRSLRS